MSQCERVSKSGVEGESDVTGELKGFPDVGAAQAKNQKVRPIETYFEN